MPFELHKVPGCYVVAFHGVFGSGKTLTMLEHGLLLSERLKKSLVANFPIDVPAVRKYARAKKYKFVSQAWCRIDFTPDIDRLLSPKYNNRVILLDEAGLDLFAREWKTGTRKRELFDRLFRIRHYGNILLYASQACSQVDKQFRDMTHLVLFCNGFQRYSLKLGHSVLLVQFVLLYDSLSFTILESNPQLRSKIIFPIYKAGFRFLLRPVFLENFLALLLNKPSHFQMLFDCFNSFDSFRGQHTGVKFKWLEWDENWNENQGKNKKVEPLPISKPPIRSSRRRHYS